MIRISHPTPLGTLTLVSDGRALVGLAFEDGGRCPPCVGGARAGADAITRAAAAQLDEYFAGVRRAFSIPLAPHGGRFRQHVWQSVCEVEFAQTRSYREIAAAIGAPKAARAVGAANGANPIVILIPCHRVIGAAGGLHGYGGGLERKRALLDFERAGATLG